MPVEIRELIIRATIVSSAAQDGQEKEDSDNYNAATKEEIIALCTAQVLRILRREKER